MAYEPSDRGLAGFVLLKLVCCGGLVLVATGAASGIGAWLLGDGLLWLIGAALAIAAALVALRPRLRSMERARTPSHLRAREG